MLKDYIKSIKNNKIGKFLYFMFDVFCYPNLIFLKNEIKDCDNLILVLGTSTYNNLGDHLINEAEKAFLKDHFPNKKILEVPTQIFMRNYKMIKTNISNQAIVVISGGGWMGSVWPDDEYRMQFMMSCFADNKIYVFPQTIFYDSEEKESSVILANANRTYKMCSDLTIFVREEKSYIYAIENFQIPNTKIYLVPDIALYFKNNFVYKKDDKIVYLMRKDRERKVNREYYSLVANIAIANSIELKKSDTVVSHMIPVWLRKFKLKLFCNELKNAKLVITDRLHGMIFATLLGCNCIVFDNSTNKIAGVYNKWLKNLKSIKFINNEIDDEELKLLITDYLNKNFERKDNFEYLENEFKQMSKIIG